MRVSRRLGGVTEWLMVADCKSAGLTPYVGSNPTPTMAGGSGADAGVAQLVEHQPSKLRVAGSSPVARLTRAAGQQLTVARVAQLVERILGKDEVRGSIPRASLVKDGEDGEDGEGGNHLRPLRRSNKPHTGITTWRRPNLSGPSRM